MEMIINAQNLQSCTVSYTTIYTVFIVLQLAYNACHKFLSLYPMFAALYNGEKSEYHMH